MTRILVVGEPPILRPVRINLRARHHNDLAVHG
jgi:hypothetical protein